ncbi:MAG: HEAT repeat domain-containing protein [Nitrospira sp.]|nr:HEAT repeat domain-containing protein [Nitrospira sp.]
MLGKEATSPSFIIGDLGYSLDLVIPMNDVLFLDDHLSLTIWYQAAFATGGLVILLLLWVLCIRVGRSIGRYRSRLITKKWKIIFEGRSPVLPYRPFLLITDSRYRVFVLNLWNECYDECRSIDARARLVDIAKRLPLQSWARTLLRSRQLHRKMLAIRTLGRLGDRSMWSPLHSLITHQNPFVALHAVQALLSIHAPAAIPLLIPVISRRTDWSPLAIATILRSAGGDVASDTLAQAATTGDQSVGARLIRHLPITGSPSGLSVLRHFLDASPQVSDDFLAACLFVFGEFQDPTDLPIVRQSLFHPTWYVRVQAATALGKLGTSSDEARLTALLNDPEWWVRYRAGEALVNLRSMTEEKLEMLQATLPLPEAQEILATALARFRQRRRAPLLTGTV